MMNECAKRAGWLSPACFFLAKKTHPFQDFSENAALAWPFVDDA
jgi:hypothetical protein